MKISQQTGNTLAEYGLIGATILGLCLLGLTQLGDSLKYQVDGFGHSLVRKPAISALPGVVAEQEKRFQEVGIDWKAMVAKNKDFQATILVSGANGATNELLSELDRTIQRLLASGEISEAEARELIKLSNMGHTMAKAEKAMEDAMAVGSPRVEYEGKTYMLANMRDLLGFDKPPQGDSWEVEAGYANSLVGSFVQAYQNAKKAGAMSNPEINKTVSALSYKIVAVADSLSWTTDSIITDKAQGASYAEIDSRLKNLNQEIASNLQTNLSNIPPDSLFYNAASSSTHTNSAGICTIGSGQDTGTACSN
jgi:hypothetical protein